MIGAEINTAPIRTMGASLTAIRNILLKRMIIMTKTIKQLSQLDGKVYVHFNTDDLCQNFLAQAEQEGFTFSDGVKPTERHTSDIIAVNRDYTINYVGSVGHIAYGSRIKYVGGEKLFRIDWQ